MRSLKGEKKNKIVPILIGSISLFILAVIIAIIVVINRQNRIVSVSLDRSSVQEYYELSEGVDLNSIKLIAVRTNGKHFKVGVSKDMLSIEDQNKLSVEGEHEIVANYSGFNVKIAIKIINLHTVEFVVNGRQVSSYRINNGDTLDEEWIPQVAEREGFEIVWFSTSLGVTTEADFDLPIMSNTTFEAKYKANISIVANKYKVYEDEYVSRNVAKDDSNVDFDLYNIDEDNERIFEVQFMAGQSDFYWGENCAFRIVLSNKYNKSQSKLTVKNNGRILNYDGYYHVDNIQEAINITIDGILLNRYTAKFYLVYLDEDGNVIYGDYDSNNYPAPSVTTEINHGDDLTAVANSIDTTWHGDSRMNPEFIGWTEDITDVKSDLSIYSRYDGVSYYSINIYQQSLWLEPCETRYLSRTGYFDLPTEYEIKIGNEFYTYSFVRWEVRVPEGEEDHSYITGNRLYVGNREVDLIAVFNTTTKEFEIDIYDDEENYVTTITSLYGYDITYIPTKASTIEHEYTFSNWQMNIDGAKRLFDWTKLSQEEIVSGEFDLYATFEEHVRQYSINIPPSEAYTASQGETIKVDAGSNFDFSITYTDAYSRCIANSQIEVVKMRDGVQIESVMVDPISKSSNTAHYSLVGVITDCYIEVKNIVKNVYTVALYGYQGSTPVESYQVEHGKSIELPEPYDYKEAIYNNYYCRWDKGVNNVLSNVIEDTSVKLVLYRQFTLVVDGASGLVDIEINKDSYSNFDNGDYANDGIGDDDCVGWYIDKDFKNRYSASTNLPSNLTLYTISATLDKLDSTRRAKKDDSISGVVVLPYSGSNTITANAFEDCAGITGVILPTSITSINQGAFQNCSNLECLVVGKNISFGTSVIGSETKLYYSGSSTEWNNVATKGNISSTVYYYKEDRPTANDSNKYWRYVNGKPMDWDTLVIYGVRYEINDSDPNNKYAVAVEYVGENPASDWCLKIVGEVDGIPVKLIKSNTFSNLNMRKVLIDAKQKITVESTAFNSCNNLNRVYVSRENLLSVNPSFNSRLNQKSIWYTYSGSYKAGKFWHYENDDDALYPEVWSEIRIGDYVYSLDTANNTAILISYDGDDSQITIGSIEYEGTTYYVTQITSYAIKSTVQNIVFSNELCSWVLDSWISGENYNFTFERQAMYDAGTLSVYIQEIDFWKKTVHNDDLSNPLRGGGELYIYDNVLGDYVKLTELVIDSADTVSAYQYCGVKISNLILHEGCTINSKAFYIAKITNLTIITNGNNTRVYNGAFEYVTFNQNNVSIKNENGGDVAKSDWSNWTIEGNNDNLKQALGIS